MNNTTLIVMPSYNQANELSLLFSKNTSLLKNILLINDGSTDNTNSVVKKYNVRSVVHTDRLGYGAALSSGLKFAQDNGYERVVTLDADGAHYFDEIPHMLQAHISNKADLTIGSRFLKSGFKQGDFPEAKINANIFATTVFNRAFGLHLTDVASGFRIIESKVLELDLHSLDMGFTFELLIKAAKNHFSICEFGISVRYNGEDLFATNQSEIISFLIIISKYSDKESNINKITQNLISEVKKYSKIKIRIDSYYYIILPLKSRNVYVFQRQNLFFINPKEFISI